MRRLRVELRLRLQFASVAMSLIAAASGCASVPLIRDDRVRVLPHPACDAQLQAGKITAEDAVKCAQSGLENPDRWVFGGVAFVPNQSRELKWHKLVGTDPSHYDEIFESVTVKKPPLTPSQYLDFIRQVAARSCPSATVTPISVTDNELVLEIKVSSGACIGGIHDELDRDIFGSYNLFTFVYTAKNTTNMSAAQRQAGMAAISAPTLDPGM